MWYTFLGDLWSARAPQILLGAVFCVLWVLIEYAARRSTWRQGAGRRRSSPLDRGTYPMIAIALTLSAFIDAIFFLGRVGPQLPLAASYVGAALMLVGLGLRYWSMDTLGQFFTNPITIRPDHVIIRKGPYRWIRHPAYTGGLLVAIGLPLVLGVLGAFLAAVVVCGFAYVYRIHIEERALLEKFGANYEAYRATTARLVPGVY
jgi:protein-S-isoprenylcysteine O-methyltransferase Ste14